MGGTDPAFEERRAAFWLQAKHHDRILERWIRRNIPMIFTCCAYTWMDLAFSAAYHSQLHPPPSYFKVNPLRSSYLDFLFIALLTYAFLSNISRKQDNGKITKEAWQWSPRRLLAFLAAAASLTLSIQIGNHFLVEEGVTAYYYRRFLAVVLPLAVVCRMIILILCRAKWLEAFSEKVPSPSLADSILMAVLWIGCFAILIFVRI